MKFVFKKLLGLFLVGALPLLVFSSSYVLAGADLLLSLALGFSVLFVFVLVSHFFVITHPLLKLIETNKLPVMTIDSNGVIRWYLATPKPPEISFFNGFKTISQLISRFSTFYLLAPQNATLKVDGDVVQVVDENNNKVASFKKSEAITNRFDFFGMPCFLYNSHLETLLTKDFLHQQEKNLFAEHNALYITRKVEEISQNAKLNADYAIALLGRAKFNIPDWVKWVLVGLLLVGIAYVAYPHVMKLVFGAGSAVSNVSASIEPVVSPLG